jgi:hypothetical protein
MNNNPNNKKLNNSQMLFGDEFIRSELKSSLFTNKTKRNITYSQFINNKFKNSFTKEYMNQSQSCKTKHKTIKPTKHEIKLPQINYLVTNLKAPFISSIEAEINKKLQISKQLEEPLEELIKKKKEEKAVRRRKSLESFHSDLSDDTERRLEEIREADPYTRLQNRRDRTIHRTVTKIINEEKGIKQEDDYENDTYRKEVDIDVLRTELNELKDTQENYTGEVIGVLQRQAMKKRMKENKLYRLVKDPHNQLKQKKILSINDCSIFSKMYLLNNNPIFEINNNIALPFILNDSNLLANVYHVNLYKLKNMKQKLK